MQQKLDDVRDKKTKLEQNERLKKDLMVCESSIGITYHFVIQQILQKRGFTFAFRAYMYQLNVYIFLITRIHWYNIPFCNLTVHQCCVQQSERPRTFADWTIEDDVRDIVLIFGKRSRALALLNAAQITWEIFPYYWYWLLVLVYEIKGYMDDIQCF